MDIYLITTDDRGSRPYPFVRNMRHCYLIELLEMIGLLSGCAVDYRKDRRKDPSMQRRVSYSNKHVAPASGHVQPGLQNSQRIL